MAVKPTWKSVERAIASLLKGKRVPVTGRTRGSAPDIAHRTLSIEVKHRKAYPAWLLDAYDQAEKSNNKAKTKLPIVILHMKGIKYEDSLVVLKLKDFIKLHDRE